MNTSLKLNLSDEEVKKWYAYFTRFFDMLPKRLTSLFRFNCHFIVGKVIMFATFIWQVQTANRNLKKVAYFLENELRKGSRNFGEWNVVQSMGWETINIVVFPSQNKGNVKGGYYSRKDNMLEHYLFRIRGISYFVLNLVILVQTFFSIVTCWME